MKLTELQTKVIPAAQQVEQNANYATPLRERFVQVANSAHALDIFSADPAAYIALFDQVVLTKVQDSVQDLATPAGLARLKQLEDPTLDVKRLIATQFGTEDLSAAEPKLW